MVIYRMLYQGNAVFWTEIQKGPSKLSIVRNVKLFFILLKRGQNSLLKQEDSVLFALIITLDDQDARTW
jgi:hypothetical protein